MSEARKVRFAAERTLVLPVDIEGDTAAQVPMPGSLSVEPETVRLAIGGGVTLGEHRHDCVLRQPQGIVLLANGASGVLVFPHARHVERYELHFRSRDDAELAAWAIDTARKTACGYHVTFLELPGESAAPLPTWGAAAQRQEAARETLQLLHSSPWDAGEAVRLQSTIAEERTRTARLLRTIEESLARHTADAARWDTPVAALSSPPPPPQPLPVPYSAQYSGGTLSAAHSVVYPPPNAYLTPQTLPSASAPFPRSSSPVPLSAPDATAGGLAESVAALRANAAPPSS
eukprot:c28273_g1_i1.p1 GENE.c28273_g1_i1~~c28273_g1_i1.p1  ORF type:complete len:302 (+),score=20.66 c28273_g1_i1:41-907(+)